MKARRMLAVVSASMVLALAFGFGVASGSPHVERTAPEADWARLMQAMRDSPAMVEMRETMEAELAAQCEAMHAQMASSDMGEMMAGMMGDAGMMTDGMTTPGNGMMSPGAAPTGDHRAHHPEGGGAGSS